MITPVSFEVAKLLKENAFKNKTLCYYFEDGELRQNKIEDTYGYYGTEYTIEYEDFLHNWNDNFLSKKNSERCFGCDKSKGYFETYSAPTIAELLMFLYEKYGIWVSVSMENNEEDKISFYCSITENVEGETYFRIRLSDFKSSNEAYNKAFEYYLANLLVK